jgi:hypothetical protein
MNLFRRIAIGSLLGVFGAVAGCGSNAPAEDTEELRLPAARSITIREDFEQENANWRFVEGAWERRKIEHGWVLAQTATDRTYNVALLQTLRFTDVDVTVRFRPVSGEEDASGGIVFRAVDGKNYFLVRANAREGNFRLYAVINGERREIAGADTPAPALGAWHTLRVAAEKGHLQAWLDGRFLIDHRDDTFTVGFVGLWTKSDSVTEFADLTITGIPA